MRICFFKSSSLTSYGGAENWMVRVAKHFAKSHEVNIVGLKYAETIRAHLNKLTVSLSKNGINYQELPCVKPPRGEALPSPIYIGQLINMFNSCDLVYIILPSPPVEGVFYLLQERIKSKLIAGFHGFLRSDILLQRLYMPLFKKFLEAFDAYHVLNREAYTWLQKAGFNNIFHIPNGVDTQIFQLCNNPLNSQFFNVLFTGRLTEDKGADILVEIIQYINEKLNAQKIEFTITGSGPLENIIKMVAKKYKNVNYLGFVDTKIIHKIYMGANLFLLPSRTEGMPLRLLEAQSCGLPAICSNIPGISDVIINGKTGQLIKVGNIESFAKAIEAYYEMWLNSPNSYYELNKKIREYIVRNYDWGIILDKIEKMFIKCAQNDSRKPKN